MHHPDDEYDLDGSPSAEDYKRALKGCKPMFSGNGKLLRMLKANYYAPEHCITATEMAEGVEYANYNAANLQYGRLAGAVAEFLGYKRGELPGIGVEHTLDVAVLITFSGGRGDPAGKDVGWTLRPELLKALEEMSWVRPDGRLR